MGLMVGEKKCADVPYHGLLCRSGVMVVQVLVAACTLTVLNSLLVVMEISRNCNP